LAGLRWLLVEGQAGLGEEAVDEVGSVLDLLEPRVHGGGKLVEAAGGEIAQTASEVGPYAFDRAPSGARDAVRANGPS